MRIHRADTNHDGNLHGRVLARLDCRGARCKGHPRSRRGPASRSHPSSAPRGSAGGLLPWAADRRTGRLEPRTGQEGARPGVDQVGRLQRTPVPVGDSDVRAVHAAPLRGGSQSGRHGGDGAPRSSDPRVRPSTASAESSRIVILPSLRGGVPVTRSIPATRSTPRHLSASCSPRRMPLAIAGSCGTSARSPAATAHTGAPVHPTAPPARVMSREPRGREGSQQPAHGGLRRGDDPQAAVQSAACRVHRCLDTSGNNRDPNLSGCRLTATAGGTTQAGARSPADLEPRSTSPRGEPALPWCTAVASATIGGTGACSYTRAGAIWSWVRCHIVLSFEIA